MNRRDFLAGSASLVLVGGCQSSRTHRCLRIASWNIGHYSLGIGPVSTITSEEAKRRSENYRDFLKEVGADFVGVCEYSEAFDIGEKTSARQVVFGDYLQQTVGPGRSYQWNAQFWKGLPAKESRVVDYEKRHQQVYYVASRLDIGGDDVWFVQTHLDWTTFVNGHEDDRASQMRALIADFRDAPRVVVAGDFNVGIRFADRSRPSLDNPDEYKLFAEAGYTLGNDGRFKTFPAGACSKSLDNIIVRGMSLENFLVWDRPDLSDHALVSADLALL